jgi:hypothetical protein
LQLADIVKDFFKQTDGVDPEGEQRFRWFLQEKAHRSGSSSSAAFTWWEKVTQ